MRHSLWAGFLFLSAGAVMPPWQAMAQSAAPMLVSTGWLADRLGEPGLVVLHVGSQTDYGAGHIPGARLVSLGGISITGERGLRLELPPVEALVSAFGKLGISSDSRIVIYPATESVQSATRVWFTLDYLGMGGRASLLDGGLHVWRKEGRALSTEEPAVTPATFTPRPRPDLVVDAEWLRSQLRAGSVVLLDARTPEFYTGSDPGSMPRGGHIPGARSIPFPTTMDADRKLKPADELRAMLEAAGAKPGKEVAVYCHIGQQATLLYFVARSLGLQPRLYDGSFQDWSARNDLPVATGAEPGALR